MSMNNHMLVYKSIAVVSEEDFDELFDEDEMPEEEQWEKESREGFKQMMKEWVDEANQLIVNYYFNEKGMVLYEQNQNEASENEFIWIDANTRMQHRYYINEKGEKKFSRNNYFHTTEWALTYDIKEIESDRKEIVGFDCYKIEILEDRKHLKDGRHKQVLYEMYVTTAIDLPFYCVTGIWRPVRRVTALEIKQTNMEQSKSFSVLKAIKYENGVNAELFELPSYFKDATEVNYPTMAEVKKKLNEDRKRQWEERLKKIKEKSNYSAIKIAD